MEYSSYLKDLRQPTIALRKAVPDVWQGFADMHRAAVADGALAGSTKELIALAISVATGCDGCIGYHAKGAVAKGATREEAAEAIGVALLMSGGPATTHGPQALAAFDEFSAQRETVAPTS